MLTINLTVPSETLTPWERAKYQTIRFGPR